MKQRPILFNGEMVKSVMAGWKTQTRRVMKPQPEPHPSGELYKSMDGLFRLPKMPENIYCSTQNFKRTAVEFCPYGEPGHFLWVRENWRTLVDYNHVKPSNLTYSAPIEYLVNDKPILSGKTRPSIFLPRWASRLLLEVTEVKAERLQDISDDDVQAEGFPRDTSPPHDGTRLNANGRRFMFSSLWEDINGPDSWDKNPWVWAVKFEVVK